MDNVTNKSRYFWSRITQDVLTASLFVSNIILFLVVIYLTVVLYQNKGNSGILVPILGTAVANILLSMVVSLIFSSLDRRSLLTPILQENTWVHSSIRGELSSFRAVTSEISSQVHNMSDYNKYSISRQTYGFNRIFGPTQSVISGISTSRFNSLDLISDVINEAAPGAEICHMISYVENHVALAGKIYDAVKSGVRIKFLLMKPNPDSSAVKARFEDIHKLRNWTDTEHFSSDLKTISFVIKNLRDNILSQPPLSGSFELRFFSNSLNFPLTIYKPADGLNQVAYTGFYGSRHVEDMPYVAWRGGDFQMTQKLCDLFDQKWDDCVNDSDY